MANAFSVPQSMGQYVEPVNINLVNAALSSKQQKYDYNVAKIDSLISEFGNIDLIREEDKKYLSDRLDAALLTVNQIQKGDLSKNSQVRGIEGEITSVLDERVMEQAVNTQRIRKFEQSVAEKREKKPELYSDINYSFAKDQAGVNKYLAGEQDSFGDLQYVDYKDVNKRINDFIIDINNKQKDKTVQVQAVDDNGQPIPGRLIETTYSGLNPTQVRQLAASQLDASYAQQIEINGWYNSNGYNSESLKSNITTLFDSKVKNLDAQTSELERKLTTSGISDADKAEIQNNLNIAKSEKASLEKNRSFLLNNNRAAATYIEQERVLTGAVEAFSSLYSTTSKVVKDEIYYADQDLAIKRLKAQHDIEKDAAASTANLITTTIPTTTEENIPEIESFVDTSIDTYDKSLSANVQAYKNALQTEADKGNQDAIDFLNEYDRKRATKTADQTDDDVFSAMASAVDYNSGLAIIGNRNFVAQIKDDKDKLSILLEGKRTAQQEGIAAHIDSTINSQEGMKAFFNNPDTKMMYNGKAYSVRNLFITNGLMDNKGNKIGDLKTHPNLLKALQDSYYADSALSQTEIPGVYKLNAEKDLNNLATSLGENPKTAFRKYETTVSGNPNNLQTYISVDPNTKTGQYLIQARRQGVYDTTAWRDQSLSGDDATIARFVRQDYKNSDVYKASLNKFYNKLPTTQMVGVTSQDKANFQRLSGLMSSQAGNINPNATINVRLDGDSVILSQIQVSNSEKNGRSQTPVEVKVLKSDFASAVPQLADRLDFNTEASFYNIDKLEGRVLKSESIKFFGADTPKKNYNYSAQVLLKNLSDNARRTGQIDPVAYIDSTTAKAALYGGNKILESRYPNFSDIIDKVLNQSSNYSLNSVVERDFNGNPYIELKLLDKRTKMPIHTITNSANINIDEFKKVLDQTPQVFYSMMVNDILAIEKQEMSLGSKTASTPFKKLTEKL